jgi:hypothetical protein
MFGVMLNRLSDWSAFAREEAEEKLVSRPRSPQKKFGGLLIVMPAKAGIQIRDFSGFRVALAIASLPGMTDELCSELRGWVTR